LTSLFSNITILDLLFEATHWTKQIDIAIEVQKQNFYAVSATYVDTLHCISGNILSACILSYKWVSCIITITKIIIIIIIIPYCYLDVTIC
jgi:hypothetical protein